MRLRTKKRPPGWYLLVWVTVPDHTTARRLARLLVEGRLAACVNILPGLQSCYRWKGRVETASEELLLAKTTRRKYPALEKAVRSAHPYEVCEVVATPLGRGSAPYLDWIAESLEEH